jgi:hypothetical protein
MPLQKYLLFQLQDVWVPNCPKIALPQNK